MADHDLTFPPLSGGYQIIQLLLDTGAECGFEDQVENHMTNFRVEHKNLLLPFDGCRFCMKQCQYRDRVTSAVYDVDSDKRFREALWEFEQQNSQGNLEAGWRAVTKGCQDAAASAGLRNDVHAAYCYFVHLWQHDFTETMAENFRRTAG